MEQEGFYKPDGLIFCSKTGTVIIPRNFKRDYQIIRKKLGLDDVNLHALRHTFDTIMLENNVL
jgi:site-specific recombinase XerC